LRSKAIELLESALALAHETRDGNAGVLIESALDELLYDEGVLGQFYRRPIQCRRARRLQVSKWNLALWIILYLALLAAIAAAKLAIK
jgi:hypothetical protein